MGPKIVTALLVTLLILESLSLPVLKVTVQFTNGVQHSELTERKIEFNSETFHKTNENIKQVQSLNYGPLLDVLTRSNNRKRKQLGVRKPALRVKRDFMKPKVKCPSDRKQYGNQCVTFERYRKLLEEE